MVEALQSAAHSAGVQVMSGARAAAVVGLGIPGTVANGGVPRTPDATGCGTAAVGAGDNASSKDNAEQKPMSMNKSGNKDSHPDEQQQPEQRSDAYKYKVTYLTGGTEGVRAVADDDDNDTMASTATTTITSSSSSNNNRKNNKVSTDIFCDRVIMATGSAR